MNCSWEEKHLGGEAVDGRGIRMKRTIKMERCQGRRRTMKK